MVMMYIKENRIMMGKGIKNGKKVIKDSVIITIDV